MYFIIGWLILLPFAGAIWVTFKVSDFCIKKGGLARLVAALINIGVGGVSAVAGYYIGPIVGWFIMGLGILLAVFGTWRTLTMTKEQVLIQELAEKLEKEEKEKATSIEQAAISTQQAVRPNSRLSNEARVCHVCGRGFDKGSTIRTCHYCRARYHKECLQNAGGCTTPGCKNAPSYQVAHKHKVLSHN